MKPVFCSISVLLLLLSFVPHVSAHPGATDEQGGHYDRSTGEYHFHHGYPAHQHEGGTCPYDFDNKTGANSGCSSGVTQTSPSPTVDYREPTTGMETTRAPSLDQPYVKAASSAETDNLPEALKTVIFVVMFAFVAGALIWSVVKQRRKS